MSEEVNNEEEGQETVSLEEFITFSPCYIELGDFMDDELTHFLHNLNMHRETPNKIVYINSGGGVLKMVHPIIDALERSNCELVATGAIYSAAFMSFFAANVPKRILPNTIGMFHYPYLPAAKLKPNQRVDFGDDSLIQAEVELQIPYEDYFNELLDIDTKMHKKLMKGHKLIYRDKELMELLEKSEKILGSYK